jgi:hypothetical protein
LRFTDAGRTLLQWLGAHAIRDQHERVVNVVPEHCTETMLVLARCCAEAWTRLGNDLEKRMRDAVALVDQGSASHERCGGTAS